MYVAHRSLITFTSDACYHVGFEKVTPARAEVVCGNLGGRLASFIEAQAATDLMTEISPTVSFTEMWLGKAVMNPRMGYTHIYISPKGIPRTAFAYKVLLDKYI